MEYCGERKGLECCGEVVRADGDGGMVVRGRRAKEGLECSGEVLGAHEDGGTMVIWRGK